MQAAAVPPAPPYQPQYQPMPYPPSPAPRPRQIDLSLVVFGAMLGGAIAVGLFVIHAALMIPPPGTGGSTDPAYVAWRNTVRTLGWAGAALLDAAVGTSIFAAWWTAFTKREMPDAARRYPFIFAVVLLVVWLFFSFSFFTFFRYL